MEKSDFEYSIKVLIIGEDNDTDELLSDTLTGIGYDTTVVSTMEQAEEVLGGSDIDLVIGDPGHSGGSWERLLNTAKKKPELPVIFITDRDDPDKDNYIKAGADGILSKPFRISRIEQIIANILINFDKSSASGEKKSRKVLVADDDDSILSILNNALTILGYDTELAGSGDEALDKFKKEKIDIMITDFMMPGLSGKELVMAAKKIKPDIPAIMITGYPMVFPPGAAKSEGVDAYLVKPFRINQLQHLISRLLPDT